MQKLSFDSRESSEVSSQYLQRFPALDCPRYLLHMKAYDQAEKVMAEIEFRSVQSKHNRENRIKEVPRQFLCAGIKVYGANYIS